MPNRVTTGGNRRRLNAAIARNATQAALLTIAAIVIAAAIACGSNARQVQRADHDTLPTPTRGYFYPVEDDANGLAASDSFDGGFESFDDGSDDFISTDEIAANPELAELFRKIESGTATDADYQRFEAILNEGFGGPTSSGQTVTGTITEINGDRLTITAFPEPESDQQSDEGTPTPTPTPPTQTVLTISDDTQFLVVSKLATADIQPGDEISATAERNEEGRIRARTLSILDVEDDSPFAATVGRAGRPEFGRASRGSFGGGRGNITETINEDGDTVIIEVFQIRTDTSASAPVIGTNIAGIPASGRVTKVVGQTVHVEAMQGPLRITIDDKSITARGRQGGKQDLRTGMGAVATASDGNALTIVIGPTDLINLEEADQFQWMTP